MKLNNEDDEHGRFQFKTKIGIDKFTIKWLLLNNRKLGYTLFQFFICSKKS